MPNQRTRVLFWADDFGPGVGGAEVWGQRYVSAMQQRGYQIEVLAADGEERDALHDLPVHRLLAGEALRRGNGHAFHGCMEKAAALQRRLQPHVVHLSIGMSAPSLALFVLTGSSAARRPDGPSPAAIGSLFCKWPDAFIAPGCLLERALAQMDWLAGDSNDTLRWAANHWPRLAKSSTVIPQALPPSGPREFLLAPDSATRTIIFIGRLSKEKGPDLALRAFSLLRRNFPELRMTFAGDGQERGALIALAAELGVAESVTFRGWIAEDEVRALIRSCSLVLMPSRQESFGLVALEAAREGRPVVATNVGGIPEVCRDGETAVLCPPDDVEALSAAAARLLADSSLAEQMGRAALAHFEGFTTWESHLDAYEELMARALNARGYTSSAAATAIREETR